MTSIFLWLQIYEFFTGIYFQLFTVVAFATFHGYGAAWLAVRMLFRPRKPVKWFGVTIFPQGMIPRHRDKLALSIGNAVGNELVSPETINNALFGGGFLKRKVETLVQDYAQNITTQEFGTLLETLPESVRPYADETVINLQKRLGEYTAQILRSEETAEAVRRFVETQSSELLARDFDETISDTASNEFLGFVEARARAVVREAAFERRIRDFIAERVDDLAETNTPLTEMITPEFVGFAKERIMDQVPPIVHELALIATSSRTREQIGALVKTEIGEYYGQLPFYQKFFVSREKLYREVDDLVNTTLPQRIEETLRGEAFATEAERFLSSAIDNLLNQPLPELVGKIAPEKLDQLKTQLSGSLLSLVQGDEMQRSISSYLTDTLEKIRPHSWRAILERIHPEAAPRLKAMLADGLLDVLRRDETAKVLNQIVAAQLERLLTTRIGKLSDYISAETTNRLATALSERIVTAAEERLPGVIAEFDIAGLVRDKINNYPAEKLEHLILSIAQQHLRTIELFGGVIGLLLGIAQAFQFWYFATR